MARIPTMTQKRMKSARRACWPPWAIPARVAVMPLRDTCADVFAAACARRAGVLERGWRGRRAGRLRGRSARSSRAGPGAWRPGTRSGRRPYGRPREIQVGWQRAAACAGHQNKVPGTPSGRLSPQPCGGMTAQISAADTRQPRSEQWIVTVALTGMLLFSFARAGGPGCDPAEETAEATEEPAEA